MNGFRHVTGEEFGYEHYKAFAPEAGLLTAVRADGCVNTMTVGWGSVGIMWSGPVFECVVRPQRYTYGFTEEAERMTLTFFGGTHKKELALLGNVSGRDRDKIAESGLTLVKDGDIAYFAEASYVLVGRKIYVDDFKYQNFIDKSIIDRSYAAGDFHRRYVCRLEDILVRDDG